MDLLPLLLIALSLSADCFAVALSGGISLRPVVPNQILRISFAFGLAQFLMPVLGWLAGQTIVQIISAYDHWVAFGLLALVGGHMLKESFEKEEKESTTDITRGFTLITLSVATSLDSLAVGLSFALLEVNIILASLVIGLFAFSITAAGFGLSRRVSQILGNRARLAGGLILIAIGVRILLENYL